MACKYYINNKVLNEQEIKEYISSNYIKESDIKLTTLGDIADILAYSNSKLILDGYTVEYTTPDNKQFKTYQEASNHISQLAKNVEDVDLSGVKLPIDNDIKNVKDIPIDEFEGVDGRAFKKINNKWYDVRIQIDWKDSTKQEVIEIPTNILQTDEEILYYYNNREGSFDGNDFIRNDFKGFIVKNKEYEQSKEIIEEWKKINNIQYNPEEIYSRGQEFSSVVGAYSNFDVNLMMQNLLSHIEDNEKAGGKFAISAYTKPVDRQIGHLEGGGGKIKFKIYPKSEDILWAANTDVYSGSVWDASEKVNKDKKSELLGVSYTKYPSLSNVNAVQPNLAAIVDDLSHHHNELAIALNFTNFELEYDNDIDYQTKKIINSINKILEQKRNGKLVKPKIKNKIGKKVYTAIGEFNQEIGNSIVKEFDTKEEAESWIAKEKDTYEEQIGTPLELSSFIQQGIQPTKTKDTLIESIDSVWDNYNKTKRYKDSGKIGWRVTNNKGESTDIFTDKTKAENQLKLREDELEEGWFLEKVNIPKEKEYTSQALINTKIAALKEVAKKYPRSLIRSEVVNNNFDDNIYFQKIEQEQEVKPDVIEVYNNNKELQKIGNHQQYSQYLDTIFPDSKVTEIDNSLYTSVINQLVQENKLEKDCTGGSKLKAEDGIATLFEKGGKWEIVTDFKNAPTHKSGGKDIYIQGKKVEVEKNELRIENDFGDVAVIPSKYRVEVEDAIKFNCYSCIDGIVEELPKMKDYAGDGTVFPFFGRYKRFKNSLPNNLKNTPEYDYAMRYYWKHNNKPKSFDESINRERPMFTMEDDGYYHAPSVEPNTLRFLKPKNHPTLQYELDWYNSDNPDAVDFRSKYNLDTSDKFYKYVPKKK